MWTLVKRARTYWKGTSLIFIVGCGIALLVALNSKRMYRSECRIVYKPGNPTGERESRALRAEKLAFRLHEQLVTRTRLEPLIDEFKLYPEVVEGKGMIEAVREMDDHISLRPTKADNFMIAFEAEDRELAQTITQRLSDSMIDEYKTSELKVSSQEAAFLTTQAKRAEAALESANRELAEFLAIHPEFAADTRATTLGQAPAMPSPRAIRSIAPTTGDAKLSALRRERAAVEREIAQAAAKVQKPQTDPELDRLTKERNEAAQAAAGAQGDLADKRARLTDQHPDVVAAMARVRKAASALQAAEFELAAYKKSRKAPPAPEPPKELTEKLETIDRQIAIRQAQLAKEAGHAAPDTPDTPLPPGVAAETEWQRLLRSVTDAKAEHETLRRRMEQANLEKSAVEATGSDQLEIIEPAYKPVRPSRGGRTKVALLGLVCSIIVAVCYAGARVVTDDRILDASDVEALGEVPLLGVIPRIEASDGGSEKPDKAEPGEKRGRGAESAA